MPTVNNSSMSLTADQLNALDRWILDFLANHEVASPQRLRAYYNDEMEDPVSRTWMSKRLSRLREHGCITQDHPDTPDYTLHYDPRATQTESDSDTDTGSDTEASSISHPDPELERSQHE